MQKLVQYSKPFDEKEVKEKNPNPFNKAISVSLFLLNILSSFISKGGGGGGGGGGGTVVLGVGVSTAITMGTKMKGICKGIKFISQMFVVKDHEMEIGYPTDVKHVAHIGWDSQSSTAPSWMNEFKTTSEFSSKALNHVGGPSWSSQEFEQSMGRQQASEVFNDNSQPTTDVSKVPKKKKLKKIKSAFSPKSTTSRSSKAMKSRSSFANNDMETTPSLQMMS